MSKHIPATIDCTPTWEAILKLYLAVLENPEASYEARTSCIAELERMARLADRYVASVKSNRIN